MSCDESDQHRVSGKVCEFIPRKIGWLTNRPVVYCLDLIELNTLSEDEVLHKRLKYINEMAIQPHLVAHYGCGLDIGNTVGLVPL